jgi:hypothetical protein
MQEIDRRAVLTAILCGGAITAVGLTAMPKAADPYHWALSRLELQNRKTLCLGGCSNGSRAPAPSPSASQQTLALLVA